MPGDGIFYALDKRVRHFHGIWHLFVLVGSICHYVMDLFFRLKNSQSFLA